LVWIYWWTRILIMPISIGLNILRSANFASAFPIKAVYDKIITYYGVPVNMNVLSNDQFDSSIANNITISDYSAITTNGYITLSANKKALTYFPKNNFFGIDSFTYNITDGYLKSNTATCSVSVFCKPPIIVDKIFKLQQNKTYTLDILNPNCHPDEIIFKDDLVDRDVNFPQQSIKIAPNSVVVTGNIDLIETTDTTIKFKTKIISSSTETTALTYKIINNLCQLDNTQKFDLIAGGSPDNPTGGGGTGGSAGSGNGPNISTGVITTLTLTSYVRTLGSALYIKVPTSYTQYIFADSVTNSDLSESGGWYSLCFSNYTAPDKFYIIMRGKPKLESNNTFTNRQDLYRGQIGPIGGKGRFVFYKPEFYNLELWVDTDLSGSVFTVGITKIFNPVNNIQYADPNNRPTASEIVKCLDYIRSKSNQDREKEIYVNSTDYSNTYTGISKPSFA
jgi:hypothetical protein